VLRAAPTFSALGGVACSALAAIPESSVVAAGLAAGLAAGFRGPDFVAFSSLFEGGLRARFTGRASLPARCWLAAVSFPP